MSRAGQVKVATIWGRSTDVLMPGLDGLGLVRCSSSVQPTTSLTTVSRHARASMKVVGPRADPGDKAGQRRIPPQAFNVRQTARDLRLAVAGMDGTMADLVQAHRALVRAPYQLRREVMPA